MSINAGPEYFSAEKKYLSSQSIEEKMYWLEEMIRSAPKHKSSENFVAELKQRLKKLQNKKEKNKSVGKSTQKTIRKEGFQTIIIGLPNTGKSTLLSKLTNAKPKISSYLFTTREPELGTLHHKGFKIQMIDLPSIGSEYFNFGLINTADLLLIVINSIEDIEKITPYLRKTIGERIIVINKSDLLSQEQYRKLEATLRSRKIDSIVISALKDQNLEVLKDKIISKTDLIRVFTKEPGKSHSPDPVVLKNNSTIKEVAESIRKGFSLKVKEARITGPSSKFPNQKVGLSHKLKDFDIVEFHTN